MYEILNLIRKHPKIFHDVMEQAEYEFDEGRWHNPQNLTFDEYVATGALNEHIEGEMATYIELEKELV